MSRDRAEGDQSGDGGKGEPWDRLIDELDALAGQRELLLGRIQEAYAIPREEAERYLAAWQSRQQQAEKDARERNGAAMRRAFGAIRSSTGD